VKQAVNAAEIDERAVVGQVLDLAVNDDALFEVVERLALAPFVLLVEMALRDSTTLERLRLSLMTFASIS
jgi:ABC-type uncharacterized transport system involved in gliding motility auxiliary subunit